MDKQRQIRAFSWTWINVALLILYLTGYSSVNLKDIKNFRQLDSICAGHPEFHPGTGIETTTGPLGQGIANAVGFAVGEILRERFGQKYFITKLMY